ncbi:MAG: sulfurtransferase TusA family protein [Promethearchaeota archaeon]
MNYDEELDVQGLVCPVPALKTKKKINKMKPGQILKVITDYKPASESVPRDLAKTKHKLLAVEEDEDEEIWEIYFKCVK